MGRRRKMIKEESLKFEDSSGDKKHFTSIPNCIIDDPVLTIWNREVYIQIKKIAGDHGKCYMSIPKLAKKCGIGKERLRKSIEYLLEHKLIKFLGKTSVMTRGGEQFANTYRIEDIWKLNADFYYKGGLSQVGGSSQGYPQQEQRGVVPRLKGGSCHACKEEPFKEEPFKVDRATPSQNRKKIPLFDLPIKQRKLYIEDALNRDLIESEITEIDNFIDYWTESNIDCGKQRWQLEKTFDVVRRIRRWFSNINKFNKFNKQNYGKNQSKPRSTKYANIKVITESC